MNWIVKEESFSELGQYPASRTIEELLKNGIIILDKWCGPTSHDVAATVKKILELEKVGHAGTLDPNVSGVLPLTLENACKVIPVLQKSKKTYVGVMHLHKNIDKTEIKKTVAKFLGTNTQKPPVRSAVARKERQREVYNIEITDINDRDVSFKVECEAGTYVRVLCHQIGQELGCGAHMSELRRVNSGIFNEEKTVKTQDLADAYYFWKKDKDEKIRDYVLPVEIVCDNMKNIIVKDSAVYALTKGSPLFTGGISKIQDGIKKEDLIGLLTISGELIAIAHANMTTEEIMKRKGLAAKTDRVIMFSDRYKNYKKHIL